MNRKLSLSGVSDPAALGKELFREEIYEVVKRYDDGSVELSNGEYIHSLKDGRYYNADGSSQYSELSLLEFDDDGDVVREVIFLGFVEI